LGLGTGFDLKVVLFIKEEEKALVEELQGQASGSARTFTLASVAGIF
jgi:hypothetical protein